MTYLANFLNSAPIGVILSLVLSSLLGLVGAVWRLFLSSPPIDSQDYNWDVPHKKSMAEREHELECKFFQEN